MPILKKLQIDVDFRDSGSMKKAEPQKRPVREPRSAHGRSLFPSPSFRSELEGVKEGALCSSTPSLTVGKSQLSKLQFSLNNVTIVVSDKQVRRKFSSFREAIQSLRWWVVLGHAERRLTEFIFA